MGASISPDDVRNYLVNYTTTDITDDKLKSFPMIPSSVAYVDRILTNNSKDYDELTTEAEKKLVRLAMIAHCAAKVLRTPPEEDWQHGPSKDSAIKAKEKLDIIKDIRAEMEEALRAIGCSLRLRGGIDTCGGDDYMPDAESLKNIDFADTDKDYSLWD